MIEAAKKSAYLRDVNKNSFTSPAQVMNSINELRQQELEVAGLNRHNKLKVVSENTARRAINLVTPVSFASGRVQNSSRQRALTDPKNAISCAAVWSAVTEGLLSGKFLHSWDEVSIELNTFDNYVNLRMT